MPMISDQSAIRVHDLHKEFLLPHEKISSLKSLFTKAFNANRSFERQRALRGVSFDIKQGEFFGILGRNGSGKSTLLKMIAGIYQPTKGQVSVHGKLVPFIELGVGFNPELTGRENVYLNGAILGFDSKQIDANYAKIVEFAELEDFMDQKLKNYSSGMQVRLAFACATVAETDILIVDEVLAVGDADFQKKCFTYFKKLKNTGKTVVLVTHDMGSVREYCDRAILIEEGVIVQEGDVGKVTRAYTELFNPLTHKEANVVRWGDRRATIDRVKVDVPTKQTLHAPITITVHTTVHESLQNEEVLLAYAVKNLDGQRLFGNKIISTDYGALKAGTKQDFSFTFDTILNEGRYFVDISLFSKDTNTYLDCWLDCAEFSSTLHGVDGYSLIVRDELKLG